MSRFWDLLEQNVLVSSALALMLLSSVIYCVIAGIVMPDLLTGAAWLVLGYFFGAKAQGVVNRKRAG